jgi:hypothetical protein
MKISKFKGMNNVKGAEGDNREPSVILNSYVTPQGRVLKKTGHQSFATLSGAKNLFGGSVMLAVAGDRLYQIEGGLATELCLTPTHATDMSYVEVNSKIYMSCAGWTGIYDLIDNEIKEWGLAIPDVPIIGAVAGDLPPGTYSVCYTNTDSNGMTGGNSPIVKFTFENQSMGVSLINPPANTYVWMTDTNGGEFFLIGNTDNISTITSPYNSLPLPSFGVIPPPKMTNIFLAFGRIWGISGKKLYYSEPSVFDWFKEANSFTFQDNLLMAGGLTEGIFVNSEDSTWALIGTNPGTAVVRRIGNGAVRGTLAYADFQVADTTYTDVPVWVNMDGIVALSNQFELMNLTSEKLDIPISNEGAGTTISERGIRQILMTLKIPKNMTTDLGAVFEEGRLNRTEVTGSGGVVVTS